MASKYSSSAGFRQSSNAYDIRKNLFDKDDVKKIDCTLNHNLRDENWVCPLGFEQVGRRCIYRETPDHGIVYNRDPFMTKVLEEMKK